MKKMILGAALLLSGVACATTREFDVNSIEPQDVETVTYTFRVFKDENHDAEAWSELVDLGLQVAKRGSEIESNKEEINAMLYATLQAIEKSYSYAGREGIHGDLRIWFDNGSLDEELTEDLSKGSDCAEESDCTKGCDGVCGGDDRKDK